MKANELVEFLIQADGPISARSLIEVSIHLPHRGSRWVASFRDERGQRVWQTTGLRDRKAALALARHWEREAKRKRAAQGAAPPRLTVRVRPGGTESQQGCLSQKEVAVILKISERAVREIEKRAIEKLRRHPLLKRVWREWQTGEVKEATYQDSRRWMLSRAECAAVYGLAKTPTERQVLKKLIALVQDDGE